MSFGLVRTILFLKLLTFAKGYSGVSIELVKKIIQFLNKDILPVIPEKGSVGASGDLAPLGHLALALIGEGEVFCKGERIKTTEALSKVRIRPLSLKPKEGISLINGTQVSTAIAINNLINGERLLKVADIAGAISVENSFSSRKVFQKKIHTLKLHLGQRSSANNVYRLLNNSDLSKVFKRGFVYLQTNSGEKITELKHLSNNQKINLTFIDGKAKANILDIKLKK